MLILIGLVGMAVSCIVAMIMDIKYGVTKPEVFWSLGLFSGVIIGVLITLGIVG